jgi:hypothetical protein
MARNSSWILGAVAFSAVVGLAGMAHAAETCCFTNARYAGTCEVEPSPDVTCRDVLEYLNSEATVGKTYCNNTSIRGGWQQVTCKEEPQSEAPDVAPAPAADPAG